MNELKQIDDYIYKALVGVLLKRVPEYESVLGQSYSENNLSDQGVYLFMNEFATYLADRIRENGSSNFVVRAFNYINEVGETDNLELLNILRVGILEILYTCEGVDRNLVRGLLNKKLRDYFDDFSKYYH